MAVACQLVGMMMSQKNVNVKISTIAVSEVLMSYILRMSIGS